jgi:hypothetical protein
MRFQIDTLIGLLAWGTAQAASLNATHLSHEITKKNLQSHVRFLSSNSLEGRLTGTTGEKLATQYIANIFLNLGLEPAGDKGTFFQEFDFTAGVSLGKSNSLSLTNQRGVTKHLVLDQDWRPLSFSDATSFESTELVFAGYGITAPAMGKLPPYDSYRGINVTNKWVVVFRYAPEKIPEERSRQVSQYSSLRYKAFTAKEHGAKGIIFVSSSDVKVKSELIPLSLDTSLSGSGIVAVSVKNNVLDNLLTRSNHRLNSLQKLQDALDFGELSALPVLSGIKISGQTDIEKNRQHGRNVLAKLRMSPNAAPLIVVGAHVDHLGRGKLSGSRARDNETGMIHPGADDNASGVASILEIAARFSALKANGTLRGNKDILFAAWSGEEFGILGSSHFVNNLMKSAPNKSLRPAIDAAINLDMVGHLREHLVLQGTGSSADWPTLMKQIKENHPISLVTQSDPYLPTDSTSFYLHGVPTLNLFTGAHDNYHTPRDKAETLNYAGIKDISEYLVDLILALEDQPQLMNYREVPKARNHTEREFKIYLGTIPDYASSDVSGVKLSGVAKNSPAEQAGLKHDDVIIELAGKNIHDIYDYTFALNLLHVGKPVTLIVLRGQEKVALTVVARYRE